MVMSFFRRGESGLEQIANRTVSMLADARHSFDLASETVLSGADPEIIGVDVLDTDERINRAEQDIRGQLVVHASVHGTDDIAVVMSTTLLIKKIERIGDQAKNILDLAGEGVSLAGAPDHDELVEQRRVISALIGETAELLADPDATRVDDFNNRTNSLREELEARIRELIHSEDPASYAVPRAILFRYWKRIVANLAGVACYLLAATVVPAQRAPSR